MTQPASLGTSTLPSTSLVLLLSAAGALPAQLGWRPAERWPGGETNAAYDSVRGRIVLFGGRVGSSPNITADTWEVDRNGTWIRRTPAVSPPAHTGQAMAFDEARQRVVMFGGVGPLNFPIADTWEYDGDTWQQRATATTPAPRNGHTMAYDRQRQRIVMFGGTLAGGATLLGDTWEYDGNDWIRQAPQTSPSARAGHAMAFDEVRQRVVLYGGGDQVLRPDMWEWTGAVWAPLPVAVPAARFGGRMASDPVRRVILLHGGMRADRSLLDDVHEWNGTSWRDVTPAVRPRGRMGAAFVHAAAWSRSVLLGGVVAQVHSTTDLDEHWEFDGNAWTQHVVNSTPSARQGAAMAQSPPQGVTVMFGGRTLSPGGWLGDTWTWNGTSWRQANPTTAPPPREGHAMAGDWSNAQVVLFGGQDALGLRNDTWTWDGTNWRSAVTPGAPARADHALAHDVARGRTVLFGGRGAGGALLNDTWEWDGTRWQRVATATSPPPREGHGLVYALGPNRVVLFGGKGAAGFLGDTWEYDGATSTWTQVASTGPTPRSRAPLVFDIVRQRTVLCGGMTGTAPVTLGDTWEWDGSNWQPATLGTLHAPVGYGQAMAYDLVQNQIVRFGGNASPAELLGDTTWLLHDPSVRRVANVSRYGTACSGTNGPPLLGGGMPFLGNPAFVLDVQRARAQSLAAMVLAGGAQSSPLGGCSVHVAGPMLALPFTTNGNGFGSVRMPVPLDVTLDGRVAFAQAVVQDPLGAFPGAALTAGLQITLGW